MRCVFVQIVGLVCTCCNATMRARSTVPCASGQNSSRVKALFESSRGARASRGEAEGGLGNLEVMYTRAYERGQTKQSAGIVARGKLHSKERADCNQWREAMAIKEDREAIAISGGGDRNQGRETANNGERRWQSRAEARVI